MKATASVLMYSGMQNPEKELTSEELQHIQDLVAKLGDPCVPQHSHLGFSGYSANWDTTHVIAHFSGHISVYNQEVKHYYDTSGVMAYLCQLITPVMVERSKNADKLITDWVADTFSYNSEPWEPNF
jgi:hypothetical protein